MVRYGRKGACKNVIVFTVASKRNDNCIWLSKVEMVSEEIVTDHLSKEDIHGSERRISKSGCL